MTEQLYLAQAAVCDVNENGTARINCATRDGKQIILHVTRETLVLMCSSATRELRSRDRKRQVQRRNT
jgi:hypothetical protein